MQLRLLQLRDQLDAIGYLDGRQDTITASASVAVDKVVGVLTANYPETMPPLPTRLGNVVLNSENYFEERYGIAHSIAWWRLAGVIESGYASILDDAQASFQFFLNGSFLAGLMVIYLLFYAARYGAQDASSYAWVVGACGLVARMAYVAAVGRAVAMGQLQRAAIDLYRLNLLTKLGVKYEMNSLTEERQVWKALAVSIALPDRADPPSYLRPALPVLAPTSASSNAGMPTIVRSLQSLTQSRFPMAKIKLSITNIGENETGEVRVIDAIQAGFVYVSGSAELDDRKLDAVATAPFQAVLPPIQKGGTVVVTYCAQAWPTEKR